MGFSAMIIKSLRLIPCLLAGGMALAASEDTPSAGQSSEPKQTVPAAPSQTSTPYPGEAGQSPGSAGVHPGTAQPVVVEFSPGSATLTQQGQDALHQVLLGETDDKKEVQVAVWSDKEWPATKASQFVKDDKKLAEQRADAIKKELKKNYPKAHINVYKMTDEGRDLAKALHTKQEELQSVFAKQGSDIQASPEISMLRDHGGSGKAVIFIKSKS